MRVLVYGAGAVGSYLGGALANAGAQVTMVARPVSANILNEKGLRVQTPRDQFHVEPRVVASVRQAFLDDAEYDVILLTMKSYDLADSLNPLLAFCPQPPPLITLQNGIGLEDYVIKQLGPGRVIAGSLTTPVSRIAPDHIVVERDNRGLALAPTERAQKIGPWINLFRQAGIETIGIRHYQSMKWSKALLNMIGNATSAILNRHPSVIYKYRPTFDLEVDMLKETLAVMRRLKLKVVDLPGTPATRLARALNFVPRALTQSILAGMVAEGRGNKMPSFHLDVVSGRKQNEVLYHNVAVAEAGRSVGVPTPVNEVLGHILLQIVQGEVDWDEYQGQPQHLVAQVKRHRRRG